MNKNVSLIVLFFISLTLTLVGCSKKEPDSTQTAPQPIQQAQPIQPPSNAKTISKHTVTITGKKVTYEQFDSTEKFYQDLNAIAKTAAEKSDPSEEAPDDNASIKLGQITDNIYEISSHEEYYGGAYPSVSHSFQYYSKNPFKSLTSDDFFDANKIKELAQLVLSNHIKSLDEDQQECLADKTADDVANAIKAGRFSVSKTLSVNLELPHVCQVADGLSIEMDKVKPYLTTMMQKEIR